jgi:hypothetical protein
MKAQTACLPEKRPTLPDLKRAFERIAEAKNPIMLEHRRYDRSKEWQDCYYSSPNTSQAGSFAKRLLKLRAVDPELATRLQPLADRLLEMQAQIEAAQRELIESRNLKKQARAAKASEAKKKSRLDLKVADLLSQVVEPYRLKAIQDHTARQKAFIETMKTRASEKGTFDPRLLFPVSPRQGGFDYRAATRLQREAANFLERVGDQWMLRENLAEIVNARAKRFAETMIAAFIHRVGTKLSDLVERKGGLTETSISGTLEDHWMSLKFADGSSFQVQSQIVWVWNRHGTHFARFPTCFRRVILPDGSKMSHPSEARIKEQFV